MHVNTTNVTTVPYNHNHNCDIYHDLYCDLYRDLYRDLYIAMFHHPLFTALSRHVLNFFQGDAHDVTIGPANYIICNQEIHNVYTIVNTTSCSNLYHYI